MPTTTMVMLAIIYFDDEDGSSGDYLLWLRSLWFQYEQKPTQPAGVNTLRSKQIGHHFTDDIFKRIFLNENVPMFIPIIEMCSQKFN